MWQHSDPKPAALCSFSARHRELIKNQKISTLQKWREADVDLGLDGHLAQSHALVAESAKKPSRLG
jgi:hypothetical protein